MIHFSGLSEDLKERVLHFVPDVAVSRCEDDAAIREKLAWSTGEASIQMCFKCNKADEWQEEAYLNLHESKIPAAPKLHETLHAQLLLSCLIWRDLVSRFQVFL